MMNVRMLWSSLQGILDFAIFDDLSVDQGKDNSLTDILQFGPGLAYYTRQEIKVLNSHEAGLQVILINIVDCDNSIGKYKA